MAESKVYEKAQTEAFGSLVDDGTYDINFRHGSKLEDFFRDIMVSALDGLATRSGASVLEAGCGAGVWLEVLDELDAPVSDIRYYGFDLTPEMVAVARKRFTGRIPPSNFKVGDVLEEDSYRFDDASDGHDLVFTFDVVQQLPRPLQLQSCEVLLSQVRPGGCLVIFDHEHWSEHGLKMAGRKLLTSRFGIKLVPEYYCNARYPKLAAIARRLATDSALDVEIRTTPVLPKRALIVRRPVADS